ncbi:gag protease polyprotein [Cucumis melo var. makuwa]|uniref:Gag protease polyprotein n=1 Tax=Cucumis melo var. makuwa TaxID=1194695 RepID=A0A5D3DBQ1_CUCMM|nr:gag protease polyprotein [Cucumis melo var. makuwa]TYK21014.1 gag protease polyprotein [Cucumis melo var. makuwa]
MSFAFQHLLIEQRGKPVESNACVPLGSSKIKDFPMKSLDCKGRGKILPRRGTRKGGREGRAAGRIQPKEQPIVQATNPIALITQQGDMTVELYDAEFDMLSHFALEMVAFKATGANKFVRGLRVDPSKVAGKGSTLGQKRKAEL